MMENHAYGQIANNPQAPFINSLIGRANLATNYYAIAHPSSTNYLEVVGGSNFNKLSDQYPDWHNTHCIPNIVPGQSTNTDNPNSGVFCPISGRNGTDAAIPVLDTTTNETSAPPLTNINGTLSIAAGTKIDGISIADQLVAVGKSWKSYQEGLPLIGADGVNVSDGYYSIGGNNAAGANVTSIVVHCVAATTYTVGGTVSGLLANAQVGLQDNGGNGITITANGVPTIFDYAWSQES